MINIIVAASENNVIGKDNKIPWHLPADMKYFKNLTTGNVVIMGRKTLESMGKSLRDRINIVITRKQSFHANDMIVTHSLAEAFDKAKAYPGKEIFIIGGGEIYKEAFPFVQRIYLTRVSGNFEGDAFFPQLNKSDWKLLSREPHDADEKNKFPCVFEVYRRK